MKKYIITVFVLSSIFSIQLSFSQSKLKAKLSKSFIEKELAFSDEQIKVLAKNTPEDKFPKTFENGKNTTSGSSWWCSGFYPGTLLYIYEGTGDKELLHLAIKKLHYLEKEKDNKGTHDLGFMLYCSFGNALRLTGDTAAYKDILTTGAQSLATRYHEEVKAIRSWDHKPWHYPVIIDNMMNLEFLFRASALGNDSHLSDIAVTHANTTMKNHFRPDYSSYHVVDYDPQTGAVLGRKTHQGAFDESAWSRGQGWALYGYTLMYRETKNPEYLKQAKNIENFIFNNPSMPKDLIPYWDFDKDKVGSDSKFYGQRNLRDVSAAALYASALLELTQYVDRPTGKDYLKKAETIIKNLASSQYRASLGENGGYILKHSVGALPLNSEVDVPLTYADYYYVEALVRYQRMLNGEAMIKE